MASVKSASVDAVDFSERKRSGWLKKKLLKQKNVISIAAITFVLLGCITFLDLFSSQKNAALYSFLDYEIGQIADRTVISEISTTADSPEQTITIEKGEKIIKKGFPVTEEAYKKFQLLANYKSDFDFDNFVQYLVFLALLICFSFFIFSPVILSRVLQTKDVIFLGINFLFVYTLTSVMIKTPYFSSAFTVPFVIPASMCILLTAVLLGQQTANSFSLLLSLGVFSASGFTVVPALFVLFTCIFAARLILKMKKRIDLVFASMTLAFIHFIVMLVLLIVFPQNVIPIYSALLGCGVGGFLSGILAIGFITPLESILNTASVFRLIDLSDLNNPVMKKMLVTASGTYSHSMMVASLAESACADIKANPLLARVGAYYHDLGKLDQPEYFVENQTTGNKHDEINPRLSVSVIRSHVKKGVEKAHQLRLPNEVVDIIAEHHGNALISYFFNEAKKQDSQTLPEEFSYMGIPPLSKESAVVMLADTVEAACRTLDKPSVSRLEKFIKTLVMQKIEHGQLDNSNLTFRELDTIQASFVQILAGYYHSRIEYPNQKDPDKDKPKQDEK